LPTAAHAFFVSIFQTINLKINKSIPIPERLKNGAE
jgi:hypothetical protein